MIEDEEKEGLAVVHMDLPSKCCEKACVFLFFCHLETNSDPWIVISWNHPTVFFIDSKILLFQHVLVGFHLVLINARIAILGCKLSNTC